MCFVLGRSTEFDCELGGTNYILKRGATNQSEINSYISYILGVWFITGSIVFESHMFWVLARLKSDELRCCLLLFSGWRNFSIFGAKTQLSGLDKAPKKIGSKKPISFHIFELLESIYTNIPFKTSFKNTAYHHIPSPHIRRHPHFMRLAIMLPRAKSHLAIV